MSSFHLAEGMVLAVVRQFLGGGEADLALVREVSSTISGSSGGLWDSREELCGALSGGRMIMSGLLGRASLEAMIRPRSVPLVAVERASCGSLDIRGVGEARR